MTPPLLTKGRYTLISPFVAIPTNLYTCVAIRTFEECREAGINVLDLYYLPLGLTNVEYSRDLNAKATLITLFSDDLKPLYVPDTYIESYPNLGQVNYNHVVLSVSLSSVPDFLDFSNLKLLMSSLVSDVTGVVPKVAIHKAASKGVITPEQHETIEVARVAAITHRTTDRAELLKANAKVTALETQNKILTKLLKDAGLLN